MRRSFADVIPAPSLLRQKPALPRLLPKNTIVDLGKLTLDCQPVFLTLLPRRNRLVASSAISNGSPLLAPPSIFSHTELQPPFADEASWADLPSAVTQHLLAAVSRERPSDVFATRKKEDDHPPRPYAILGRD